jgi:hypothetical protein
MDELFVADSGAHRVLGYFTPLSSSTASIVFGQGTSTSFTTGDCNHPSSTVSASSLCGPKAVAADASGNIYIADTNNNRVLEFNETNPPSNVTANVVFGQGGSTTTNGCNQGGVVSANSLCGPAQMAFDAAENLYIADAGNARTLEFNTPLAASATPGSGDTTADRVFGQADNMTSHACNFAGSPVASTECGPSGIALDTAGDLFVVDAGNDRILKYDQPLAATPTATPTATSTGATPTPTGTSTPTATTTATSTSTGSSTPSKTPTPTATATATATQTPTQTATPTATPTQLPINLIHPQMVSFGTGTTVGKTSKAKKIAIKNSSSKSSHLSAIIQMETVTPPFAVKSQCRKKLAPGKSCKFSVTFTPPDTTPQVGTLMIFDNVVGSPQTVTLSGTGKPPK